MLIGNYSVLSKSPGRFFAGSTTSVEVQVRSAFNKSGANRNKFYVSGTTGALKKYAVPTGYYPPYTWVIPQVSGEIGSNNGLTGTGTASAANLAGGLNGTSALTGTGDITSATGSLIVSAVAALVGSGAITNAAGQAFLNAVASLTGSGDVTAAVLSALGIMAASPSGSGSVSTASTATAVGTMAAALTLSGGTLTTANVGESVWKYMIEAGYTAEQIVRIIAAQAAGAATGLEGANPQFTGLDGTTLRIDGAYSAGTRTIDSLNGA